MRLYQFLGLALWAASALAADPVVFPTDREGKSFYGNSKNWKAEKDTLQLISSGEIRDAFKGIMAKQNSDNVCAYNINRELKQKLNLTDSRGAIYHLRFAGKFDDVVAGLLLRAEEVETAFLAPKFDNELHLPKHSKVESYILKLNEVQAKLEKGGCLDSVFKALRNDEAFKEMKEKHFESLLVAAKKQKAITKATYQILERARIENVDEETFDIKTYLKKYKSLRANFPLANPKEKNDFVTLPYNKGESRRQRLLENYTDIQIMLMADLVKRLRTRLDSDKIEILIYNNLKPDEVSETIPLEPMERFRFAIRILRKEKAFLGTNTYFAGVEPDYMDIITASYETGLIVSEELEQLASLEEIWDPTKSFWQKAMVWVKQFGGVAAIVVPQPFGFLPTLGIMAVDLFFNKETPTDTTGSLF